VRTVVIDTGFIQQGRPYRRRLVWAIGLRMARETEFLNHGVIGGWF